MVRSLLRLSHFYNLSFFVDILKGNSQPINFCKIHYSLVKSVNIFQLISSSIQTKHFNSFFRFMQVLCSVFNCQNPKFTTQAFLSNITVKYHMYILWGCYRQKIDVICICILYSSKPLSYDGHPNKILQEDCTHMVVGHLNLGLFNPKLQPRTFQP